MNISADATLPFPRPLVFATYRDKLPDMISYFPNVRRIEISSRSGESPSIEIVNVWHGGGDIPAAARAFLSETMLSWTDHARWNENEWVAEWRIETHAFPDAVECKGASRFFEEGNQTRLEIRGTLAIDATKIKGVPKFLAGTVARAIEDFLGKKIKPNLVEVSEGVKKYLTDQPPA